jgi:hypothetical protein
MVYNLYLDFHYERDFYRTKKIYNDLRERKEFQLRGFFPPQIWQTATTKGERALEELIAGELLKSAVTVVLIGYQTAKQKYVLQTLTESYRRRKGMLGIYIHRIKDQEGRIDYKGRNPFDFLFSARNGKKIYLSQLYPTYDWVSDDGFHNFDKWVAEAVPKKMPPILRSPRKETRRSVFR